MPAPAGGIPPRQVLVGLGNPIMADDAAGLAVARELHALLPGFDLDLTCSSGFEVVDRILDYDLAVIVDSMTTGEHPAGTVTRLGFKPRMGTARANDAHGVGFFQAIELARACGAAVPSRILVYGIEVENPGSVADKVSSAISGRIAAAAAEIARDLAGELGRSVDASGGRACTS